MNDQQIEKYTRKLLRDRTAVPESIRFYRLDDVVITNREDEWLHVFTEVFSGLDITALLFAKPTLPFADLLVERADPGSDRLVPKTTIRSNGAFAPHAGNVMAKPNARKATGAHCVNLRKRNFVVWLCMCHLPTMPRGRQRV